MLVGNNNNVIGNMSTAEQVHRQYNSRSSVNFTSSGNLEHQVVEHIGQKSKLIKILDKAGRMNSEIVGIVVNNIGTALVAPIFIAFNPISNQDKDTRYYSAMRQPISAVLAIAAQFGITQKFNKFFDNAVKNGEFDHLNLSKKVDEKGIKDKIVEDHPNLKEEELKSLQNKKINEKYIENSGINSIQNAEDLFKKLEINPLKLGEIDNKNDTAVKKAANLIHLDDRKKMEEKVKELIGNKNEKAANQERLKYDNDVKATVKALKKKGESILPEIKGLDINKFKADLAAEQLAEKLGVCGDENITKAANRIKNAGGAEEFLEKCGLSKDLNKQTAENAIKNLEHHLGEKGMFDKAAKAIVNNKVAFTETRLKAVKLPVGIALSVLTLPITCTALNWIYPRFMEIVFPNLSNSKKEGK